MSTNAVIGRHTYASDSGDDSFSICTAPEKFHTIQTPPTVPDVKLHAVLPEKSQLWPNGAVLSCCFLASAPGTQIQQNHVKETVKEWEKYANIRFNWVLTQDAVIRVTFAKSGSWSLVGTDAEKEPDGAATVNLGWISTWNETLPDNDRGVILHEFGHVLGFLHEHQSPARDSFFRLNEKAVINHYMSSQGWSEEDVREQILEVYNGDGLSCWSELDPLSIMMYFMPAAMNDKGKEIKPNNKLSNLDKAYVMINYPRFSASPDPAWTIEKALDVAKVDKLTREDILLAYKDKDAERIRDLFSKWSLNSKRMVKSDGTSVLRGARARVARGVNPGGGPGLASQLITHAEGEDIVIACVDCSKPQLLESVSAKASPDSTEGIDAATSRTGVLWTNASTLTFSFVGEFTATQQKKVQDVASVWTKYANIQFEWVTDSEPADIRIAFDKTKLCCSAVGRESKKVNGYKPSMNLGCIDGTKERLTALERAVILHEFGHAIGLFHEHRPPTLGGEYSLQRHKDNEADFCRAHGFTMDRLDRLATIYSEKEITNYDKFDCHSIMTLFLPSFMNERGEDVLPKFDLSSLDKAWSTINYPRPASHVDPDCKWTFDYALELFQVDVETKKKLTSAYRKGDWGDVRYQFALWCTTQRAPPQQRAKQSSKGQRSKISFSVQPPTEEGTTRRSYAIAARHDELWLPGDTITYSFQQEAKQPDKVTDYRKSRIEETFSYYEQCTNLKFKYVKDKKADVRIFFGEHDPSIKEEEDIKGKIPAWASLGKRARYTKTEDVMRKTMEGGDDSTSFWISDFALPRHATNWGFQMRWSVRTLFHEVGHLLGLYHEHQSPHTIVTHYSAIGEEPERPIKLIDAYSIATLYDPESVMLYGNLPIKDTGKKTMSNAVPSDIDRAALNVLYPFPPGVPRDKFDESLETIGIIGRLGDPIAGIRQLRAEAFTTLGNGDKIGFARLIEELREVIATALDARNNEALKKVAHGVRPQRAPDADASGGTKSPAFLDVILQNLKAVFSPTGNQIFTLQFPGRFLAHEQYAWDTKNAGVYGPFSKPTIVNESEFRLVDQMYDLGTVVSGPNGINLSIVYEQCLNNLLPTLQSPTLSKQQDKIRHWLMKEITPSDWVLNLIQAQEHSTSSTPSTSSPSTTSSTSSTSLPSSGTKVSAAKPEDSIVGGINTRHFALHNRIETKEDKRTINRIELAEALMQEYLTAKTKWELERDEMIRNATPQTMESVTRTLAHITPIKEAQLASKYTDAVVRGYSHSIRQYLGYLDIKTPSEFLQDAKDALRESAMSSLTTSMKVYPVQLQPIDWFQGLSTSFTPEDLTTSVEQLEEQLVYKSRRLDFLNERLAILHAKPQVNLTKLSEDVDKARAKLDEKQAILSKKYNKQIIVLAKTCLSAAGAFSKPDFLKRAAVYKIDEKLCEQIEDDMKGITEAQAEVTTASRVLVEFQSGKALAQATDTEQEKTSISLSLTSLTKEVDELTAKIQRLRVQESDRKKEPESLKAVDILPPIKDAAGGSRWQDIVFTHEVSNKYSSESQSTSSSRSTTDCNLFFGSYHSQEESASASASSISTESRFHTEIGFRATLVTVDRGGWFQPQFFKQSKSFHKVNPTLSWSTWPDGVKTVEELKQKGDEAYETLRKSLLPAFPVGFVICKDITIKIHMSSAEIQSQKANMEKSFASSGGVLCWSTNSAGHEKSSSASQGLKFIQDGCVIRIPGPQILGYIQQLTDQDETQVPTEEFPDELFFLGDQDYSDLEKAAKDAAAAKQPSGKETPPTS